jgi:hypothetical protein
MELLKYIVEVEDRAHFIRRTSGLLKYLYENVGSFKYLYENVGSVRTVFYCPSDVSTRPVFTGPLDVIAIILG